MPSLNKRSTRKKKKKKELEFVFKEFFFCSKEKQNPKGVLSYSLATKFTAIFDGWYVHITTATTPIPPYAYRETKKKKRMNDIKGRKNECSFYYYY